MSARIAVLLDHPGAGDSRILWSLSALRGAGYDVRLFALYRFKDALSNAPIEIGGVCVTPVWLNDSDIVPMPRGLIRVLSGVRSAIFRARLRQATPPPRPHTNSSATPHQVPINAPPKSEPDSRIGRVNAALGTLFWHRALARTFHPAVSDFNPDLIIANDLATLGCGATLAQSLGAKLIYDAHELELGRNNVGDNLAEQIREAFERKFIRRADAVITVSETIAERLGKHYGQPRPTVVLNAPPALPEETEPLLLRTNLGIPDTARIALYLGSMVPGRGLEVLIEATAMVDDIYLVIMGGASDARMEALRTVARDAGISPRVHVLPPVPSDQVHRVFQAADLSVIPIHPSCESYRLSLPTKLFHSLRAGVPVVATPLPEIEALLAYLQTGVVAEDFSAKAMAAALQQPLTAKTENSLSPYSREAANESYLRAAAAVMLGENVAFERLPHADAAMLETSLDTGWSPRIGPLARALVRLV